METVAKQLAVIKLRLCSETEGRRLNESGCESGWRDAVSMGCLFFTRTGGEILLPIVAPMLVNHSLKGYSVSLCSVTLFAALELTIVALV